MTENAGSVAIVRLPAKLQMYKGWHKFESSNNHCDVAALPSYHYRRAIYISHNVVVVIVISYDKRVDAAI